jgi:beta-lactamase class A
MFSPTVIQKYKLKDMTVKVRWLLPSLISVLLLSSPAKAANLAYWHFNANQNQLDLTTDEGVQPSVEMIVNPTRLVIDLPGITLQQAKTIHQKIGPVIQEIRVGQVDDGTTRMVIELAPNYTLDPAKILVKGQSPNRWTVNLPNPQRIPPDYRQQTGATSEEIASTPVMVPKPTAAANSFAGVVPKGREMLEIKPQIQALRDKYKSLTSGMFFLDLDTGNYLDISGDRVFPAASTIKLPILVAFFQDVDAGKVSLNETLVMRRSLMTGGSGTMQYKTAGTKFSISETVAKMITISDNTATNMIIDRLGGISKLNQRFRSWGLKDTVINNMLADLRGTNKTSSKDLVRLLALLANKQLVSQNSNDRIIDLLHRTTIKTLLPSGLGPGADIADKTGDIGFLVGDAGIITMPSGKRYLAGIFVRRPYKSPQAREFVRQVSGLVYKYLDQPNQQSTVKNSQLPSGAGL